MLSELGCSQSWDYLGAGMLLEPGRSHHRGHCLGAQVRSTDLPFDF